MQDKKNDIIQAALSVFQKEGLKGARMEKIAQTACVSKRTLYKHFPNKDLLFNEICQSVIKALSEMSIPDHNPNKEIKAQLLTAVQHYISQVMEPHFLMCSRVLMAELMRSPSFAKSFYETFEAADAPLEHFLKSAANAKQIRINNPTHATAQLLTLFKSTVYFPAVLHNEAVLNETFKEKTAQECVENFLNNYSD